MTTRLSLCIATLNRADVIGETLQSIVSQLTDQTELLVVDGASTDATEAVVHRFGREDTRVRYHRLAKNSGVDRDFNTAVELANGEYCWLMSDDDLLKPGAIAMVLKTLARKPSLVVVNAEARTPDLRRVLKDNMLGIAEDETYTSGNDEGLFVRAGQYLSFIGCVVIRRDLWLQRERGSYFGTLFIHVGVIFQKPLPASAIVLAAPLVTIRYGNAMWTPRSLEIWMFKWPQLVWSFRDFSDAAKAAVYNQHPYLRFSTLVLFRAKGALNNRNYRESIAPRVKSRWRRLAGYILAATPGVIVNTAVTAFLALRAVREEMPLFELRASPYHYSRLLRPPRRAQAK